MMRCTRASAATNSDFTPRRCSAARRQASSAIAPPSMRWTADIAKLSVCPRAAPPSRRRSSIQSGAASANFRLPPRRISPASAVVWTCSIANDGGIVTTLSVDLALGLEDDLHAPVVGAPLGGGVLRDGPVRSPAHGAGTVVLDAARDPAVEHCLRAGL